MVRLNFKITHKLNDGDVCGNCPMLSADGGYCNYYKQLLDKKTVHFQAYELTPPIEVTNRHEDCIDEQGI